MLFGVWLILSPWVLGFYGTTMAAALNSWIVGVLVLVFAFGALYQFRMWEEGINLVLGLWLIAAPFLIGFAGSTAAMWNHIIFGVLIAGDAVWVMLQKPHVPHKHKAA